MREVTLDTNCIIDLEEGRPNAFFIRALVAEHARGHVRLRLPAIAASENQPDGGVLTNFAQFQARVERVGLGGVRLLQPPMRLDVTYLDFCVLADETMLDLERRIQAVLHPAIEVEYAAYCAARGFNPETPLDRKWRNAKCDVLVAWSHIQYQGDVLVTADGEFHVQHKKDALVALGAGLVVLPQDATAVV